MGGAPDLGAEGVHQVQGASSGEGLSVLRSARDGAHMG